MDLVTNNFKHHLADQMQESFTEPANNVYYVFVSKHTPYATNTTPTPTDDLNTTSFDAYKDMIYGRRIEPADINLGIRKIIWQSNTVYTEYEHNVALYNKNFYVAVPGAVDGYDVFKCLSNNKGAPSTYYPRLSETSASDQIYETSDGYQWKYMYSINQSQWNKFSTSDYMPVYTNANVSGNAISGTIDYVEVVDGGSGYTMFTQGLVQAVQVIGTEQFITIEPTSSSTTDFYKNCAIKIGGEQRIVAEYIVSGSLRRVKVNTPFTTTPTVSDTYYISPLIEVTGPCDSDGSGFQARAIVNSTSNEIYKVEITNRGSNYSFANLVAKGGVTSVAETATFKAMISPHRGHGFDPPAELGCKNNIISVKFDSTLSSGKVINENDFRTFGILRDPKYANVVLTITGASGAFDLAETVTGATSNAQGIIQFANSTQLKVSNVSGIFATSETITGSNTGETATLSSITQPVTYFNQAFRLVLDNVVGTFQEDEEVWQGDVYAEKNANGALYFANSSVMYITGYRGTFNVSDDITGVLATVEGHTSGATAKITGIVAKDLVDYEGEIVYIENVQPITKNPSQTETVKIILEF